MRITYLILLPLFAQALTNKIKERRQSIATGNKLKLKADNFFLALVIAVFALLVVFTELA